MRLSGTAQRRVATFLPPLVVALVALPFVLRQNSWWEWTTAYWLLERQAEHVSAHGVPTLYLHTNASSFYPLYLYYAGFTLSVLAYPAALVGAWPVFAATCVAAPVAGYLGIWWTARNLGLSHRLAVLPGLAFAAAPYMVTDLYGRGSWAELVALNAVPVLLGGLTALLWHPGRGRGRALAAITGAAAILAGTHNISLLLAAIVLPLLVLALLPLVPPAGGVCAIARRLGLGALAVALGAGLTGAWLVPNLWFGRDTWAARPEINQTLLQSSTGLDTTNIVLSITPKGPSGSWLYVQPPILPLAWAVLALVVVVALLRRRGAAVAGAAVALVALGTALVVVIVHPRWWPHFPSELQSVQNPSRIVPYVAIVGVVAIAVALVALPAGRIRTGLTTLLVLAVGAQVYMSARIAIETQPQSAVESVPLRHGDIAALSEPPAYATAGMFPPYQFRVARPPLGPRTSKTVVAVGLADPLTSDAGTLSGEGKGGDHVLTSLIWSRLVRVEGDVRITGATSQGVAVATVTRTGADGRWSAKVEGTCAGFCLGELSGSAWQLPAGRLLTLLSVLIVLAAVAVGVRRRRSSAAPPPAPVAGRVTREDAAPVASAARAAP